MIHGPQVNSHVSMNIQELLRSLDFPGGTSGKEPTCQLKRLMFDPWLGRFSWKRAWQPTPVFLPEESHWQRNLMGYSPLGHTELDTTVVTLHICTQIFKYIDIYYIISHNIISYIFIFCHGIVWNYLQRESYYIRICYKIKLTGNKNDLNFNLSSRVSGLPRWC